MKKVFEGNLIAEDGKTYDYTEIKGNLEIKKGIKSHFPNLESVGGNVWVYANATLSALKSVGGNVWVDANATLSAESLESVGGNVRVDANGKIKKSSSIKENDSLAITKCRALLIASFLSCGYSFADGILAKIISKRGNVSRVIVCGKTKISYLVTDGENYSHGKTLKEARDSLLYKISSRDTSEFKSWTMEKIVSKRDGIRAYRAITGACEAGVRDWMEKHETPAKISIKGIIKITQGAYGAEKFSQFFGGIK